MKFIDTHSHLFVSKFNQDRREVVQHAIAQSVEKMVLPNIDVASIQPMFDLADEFPNHCYATLGIHPCDVKEDYIKSIQTIEALLAEKQVVGIGETGLDYHWDTTHKRQQQESLRIHCEWAIEHKLPIILHTRKSFDDTLTIMQEMNDPALRGIFHCFGGSVQEAEAIQKLGGFMMGIGGVVTYKNSTLPSTLKEVPLDHIVLETDAPYLPPVPYRGKRNESAYIPFIAKKLSEIYNCSLEEIAEVTSCNANVMFDLN